MALVPETAFPGQIKPATSAWPYGEAQDITTPGDGKGTPWKANLVNDLFGMQQSFLSAAGIVPNGQPDSVENPQYLRALKVVINSNTLPSTLEIPQLSGKVEEGQKIHWQGYRQASDGGSNWGTVRLGAHTADGGSIFSIDASTYIEANLKGRSDINIMKFGADRTGVLLANDAINKAANYSGGHAFVPNGTFRVENFVRDIQAGNTGQSRLVLTGVPTPRTAQHQFMVAKSVIEGSGDIFKDVVNYAFTNLGVRNSATGQLGTLFSMYGMGLEGGRWDNCYFGNAEYHFARIDNGSPTLDDYIIGPQFRQCAFFHATIQSRRFDGVVAGYREDSCYTAHSQSGLFMKSPGPGCAVDNSIFEYIFDHAIDATVFGSVANYTIRVTNTFFESIGGASTVNIPRGQVNPPREIAFPSVKLGNLTTASGAELNALFKGCFWTYTDTNPPTCHIYLKDANNLNLEFEGNKTQPGIAVFSTDPFVPTEPNGENGIRIRYQNAKGPITTKGLTHVIEDVQFNVIPFTISKNFGDIMTSTRCTGDMMFDQWSSPGKFDHQIRHSVVDGISFRTVGTEDDVGIKNGEVTIFKPGKGIVLTSPDGVITKTLTLDNSGNIVVN